MENDINKMIRQYRKELAEKQEKQARRQDTNAWATLAIMLIVFLIVIPLIRSYIINGYII